MRLVRKVDIPKKCVGVQSLCCYGSGNEPEWKRMTTDKVVLGLLVDKERSQNTNDKGNPNCETNRNSVAYHEIDE